MLFIKVIDYFFDFAVLLLLNFDLLTWCLQCIYLQVKKTKLTIKIEIKIYAIFEINKLIYELYCQIFEKI